MERLHPVAPTSAHRTVMTLLPALLWLAFTTGVWADESTPAPPPPSERTPILKDEPSPVEPSTTTPGTAATPGTRDAQAPQAAPPAADRTDDSPAAPSAEETLRDLMGQRQAPPPIDPTVSPHRPTGDAARPGVYGLRPQHPVVAPRVDPAVLGIAPGQPMPELRREGEFVVTRRGRIVRSGDGAQALLVFESDSPSAPEMPMFLMPCQMLQNMENLVLERGDRMVFVVSGQVFTYRGVNYLLPTLMKPAPDKGNLQN